IVSTHIEDTVGTATVTVNTITADDVINADEAGKDVTVSGSVTADLAQGDIVSFTVNDKDYSATVKADLTWEVNVQGLDLKADTEFTVQAVGEDGSSNLIVATAVSTHTVDLVGEGSVTVNNITSDNAINKTDAEGKVTVSGTVGGELSENDKVSFTVNGKEYTAIVDSDLNWKVEVEGSDLVADSDKSFVVTATGTDDAGNPIEETAESKYIVTIRDINTPTLDTVGGDTDNTDENDLLVGDNTPTLSGTAEAGMTVKVTYTAKGASSPTTEEVLVDGNGNYSITLSKALSEGNNDITLIAEDEYGNKSTILSKTIEVDSIGEGIVTVDNITSDNILNAAETSGKEVTVSGTVGKELVEGDTVTFTVHNTTYTTTVKSDLTWEVNVQGSDLVADADKSFEVIARGEDNLGNLIETTETHEYIVDVKGEGTVTVDPITTDDIINIEESQSSAVRVSGSVDGELATGDKISFTVNGTDYSTTVDIYGNWAVDVKGSDLAADLSFTVTANGVDNEGNPILATAVSTHTKDLVAEGTVTVNPITADDIINKVESEGNVTVSGKVSGELAEGDIVRFTVNGKDYSASVKSDLTWEVEVAGSDLAADSDKEFVVTAEGRDDANNLIEKTVEAKYEVDVLANTVTLGF
ncbi:MAG: Ig-like domain-containing protein, partial [Arcobacter sp.]|nr:Ig-like domain-containing protein [Arcobacter sp.]